MIETLALTLQKLTFMGVGLRRRLSLIHISRLDDVEGKRTAEADGAGMNVMKGAGAGGQASQAVTGPQGGWNQRKTMLLLMAFSVVLLLSLIHI